MISWFLVIVMIALASLITTSTAQKPHQKSLLIVFDGTGSMGNNLDELKPVAKEVVDIYSKHESKPIYNYVLTVFRHPKIDPTINSQNPNDLLAGLDRITAYDGGGPEYAITGLIQALRDALPNSIAFVISDASAFDYHRENEAAELLRKKQTKVFFLIVENCLTFEDVKCKVYPNLARISGGQMLNVNTKSLRSFIKTLEKPLDPKYVELVSIIKEAAGTIHKEVNVDQSIQELCASVSGKNPRFSFKDSKAQHVKMISELTMSSYKYGCIENTQSGRYDLEVTADSGFEAKINARSNLKFDFGFSVDPATLHSETNVQPLAGYKNILSIFPTNSSLVALLEDLTLVTVPLNINEKPKEIVLPLTKIHDDAYATQSFSVPKEPFKVILKGVDMLEIPINREISSSLMAVSGTAPEVTVEATEYEFCATEKVELKCRVKSQIPIKVSWTFNGHLLKEERANQSKQLSLNFKSLDVSNKGSYKCDATNDIGSDSKTVSLSVLKAPKVKITTATTKLSEPLEYSMQCDVTDSDGSPTIQWINQAGSVLLSGSAVYNFTAHSKDNGMSISCEVKNKKCTIRDTKTFEINFVPLFNDGITDPVINKVIIFGIHADSELNCESNRNTSTQEIQWFLNTHDNKSIEQTEQLNKDKMSYLETETSMGNYECVINSETEKVRRQFNIKIVPQETPRATTPRQIYYTSEGNRVELICECQKCLPITKATWIYDPSSDIKTINKEDRARNRFQSFLRIDKAEATHSGRFKCRLENSKGNDEVEVTMIVKLAPRIESISISSDFGTKNVDKKVEVVAGKDYEFICNAESYPAPQTSWNFNGHEIMDINTFRIVNASVSDEGTYECVAKNAVKTIKKNLFVRLMAPPTSDANKTRELNLEKKSYAELTCEIFARPKPDIKWKFNGVEIHASSRFDMNDNTLGFTVGERDAGTFICEGSNDMGSLTLEFVVKVKNDEDYSPWSDWSSCAGDCDTQGVQQRTRNCLVRTCSEDLIEEKPCQNKPCWSSWSRWTPECPECSKVDDEFQLRWRRCLQSNASKCKGSAAVRRSCNVPKCESADNWNPLGDWSECPTCYGLLSVKPTQKRARTCKSLTNENCNGKKFEERECDINVCASSWSDWSDWSPCSVTCGFGKQQRTRNCLSGEGNCPGLAIGTKFCFPPPCDS